jgi:NitT/TauT family transport system ATP-binding protein
MPLPPSPVTERPAAGRPIVALRGVGKTFERGTVALEAFDLEVREGEFVSLLGPSGCGKSTALRIVAGLSTASKGLVEWPNGAGEIGFVFQEPTLMPWASIASNVQLPLKLAHAGEATSGNAVRQSLDRVGLTDFADAFPRELSGGMKMRASIARALVTEPQLLLMDEPFAALDEITRFKLNNDLLAVWHALRRTVIFVMTPRPGRVYAEIAIDAPYPRDERFRTSAEYAGFCRQVAEELGKAMSTGGVA